MALVALGLLLFLPPPAGAVERSCGWFVQVSGGQINILYPDQAATYWGGRVPLPDGAHIELAGAFPHARYLSLITYTSPDLSAIDILRDTDIVPENGLSNPFLPGARRDAADRNFVLRIVRGRLPEGGREPNTIYTENAEGTGSNATATFMLRIYLPDLGTGLSGGVPLPEITLVLASGERITYPRCPDTDIPDIGLTELTASAGFAVPLPEALVPLTNNPGWHKYVGGGSSLITGETDNGITGDSLYPTLTSGDASPQGGLGDTPDNRYIYSIFAPERGQVLLLHAKAPTTPETLDGHPVMGGGHQVRYWSICTNLATTQYVACTPDERIPLDARGYYSIAISSAAARPRNATESCGIAWLPAGPSVGLSVSKTILALRNLLPAPSFTQSTHAAQPGSEEADMGEYYPGGTYFATTADFEALGCINPPGESDVEDASGGSEGDGGGGGISSVALVAMLLLLLLRSRSTEAQLFAFRPASAP